MPLTPGLTLQTRGFWLVFITVALLAAVTAFRLLFLVEPGLGVDISFSRQQAVTAARDFRLQRFPALETRRSAALFTSDRDFQNYVELEGGGSTAYQALVDTPAAATHQWQVREFFPGRKTELLTWFSPAGTLLGWEYRLPDDEPGATLDEASARSLAEAGARELLGPEFGNYRPLATQQTEQAGPRRDYSFTYEHANLQPGAARLRLELKVAGDRLVAAQRSKFTPEAFRQRFAGLRTLNEQLSTLAAVLMLALFGLGGLLGGGIWLYRRHQLQLRRALVPGIVVALGLAATRIAGMPMTWMGYQTQTSEQSFILQQLAQAGLVLVAASLLLGAIYAVAEGLVRHAMAGQPRLWDSLRTPVLASPDLAGRILGAYAWTGYFLLYALAFLALSSRVLGWWQPSSLNVDPNVLASWRPALAPIFNALLAGTWEECLFRAIPLSLALLLDRRFGSGRKLTLLMLVLQALIFAAAHANYPQLPGYSRVVELFLPAIVFGLVFLRFGLLPCMLTHFLYDLALMSMPIFLAADADLWLDRTLVLLAGLAPLLLLARARLQQGSLLALDPGYRNGEQPVPPPAAVGQKPAVAEHAASAWQPPARSLLILALAGAALLLAASLRPARIDWPRFDIDRAAALQGAEAVLQERGVVLDGEWHASIQIDNTRSAVFDHVWRESGVAAVQALLGTYIDAPRWSLRWRRFDGPVEERTEAWQVHLAPDGRLLQLIHQIPEGRPGASLDQDAATALARRHVDALGWTPATGLALKSVAETRRPARSDWTVTLEDANAYRQGDAVAVILVRIAGDEVVGYSRSIDVPESWVRAQTEQQSRRQPWRIASTVLGLLLAGLALATFFRRHSGRRFDFPAALPWLGLTLVPLAGTAWLRFDVTAQAFQTTMSWSQQVGIQMLGLLVSAALLGALIAMAAQAVQAERPHAAGSWRSDALLGGSLGLALPGIVALVHLLLPTAEPPTALVGDWATPLPLAGTVLNAWRGLGSSLFPLLLALGFSRFIDRPWRLWGVAALALLWWLSGALAQREWWLALAAQLPLLAGIALGYGLIRRGQLGAAVALMGTLVVVRQGNLVAAIYPLGWVHALAAFLASGVALLLLLQYWHRR